LKEIKTYRIITASFLVALIVHVLIFQSIHHVYGHQQNTIICDEGDTYVHLANNDHQSCNICLFHFDKSYVYETELNEHNAIIYVNKTDHYTYNLHFGREYFTFYLRGPPIFES